MAEEKYFASHTEEVAASFEDVWRGMLDKVRLRGDWLKRRRQHVLKRALAIPLRRGYPAARSAPRHAPLTVHPARPPVPCLPPAQIYHPDRFVPGVTRVEIVRDDGPAAGGVERKMWMGAAPFPIHEIITTQEDSPDSRTVVFTMLTHPLVTGRVLNTITRGASPTSTAMTFVMEWTRRPDAPPDAKLPFASAKEGITRAVLKSKEVCEAMAASGAAGAQ